jgi:hypothetical protein
MNDLEFNTYLREMEDDYLFNLHVSASSDKKLPIKMGNITIPNDKETFNKMWIEKAFDDIDENTRLKINPLSLLKNDLHIGRYKWDEYFFRKREDLMCMSALKIWRNSEYFMRMTMDIYNILKLSVQCDPMLEYADNPIEYYLSCPPEVLMYPDIDIMLDVNYSHPVLVKIYREIVLRYQYLGKKTDDERTSIYIEELNDLYIKIKFIQKLMYFGVESVIRYFKVLKQNYMNKDPLISDIKNEPNQFQETSYKEALYKFYLFCISYEVSSPTIIEKAHFLGNTVIHFEEIKLLITNYLLPLSSCIKQDKLKTVCCHQILCYLKPEMVTNEYIIKKLASTL